MAPHEDFLCGSIRYSILYHLFLQEIPMNFVDPKEIDIPRHGTKNRYKTILPSKFLELTSLCRTPPSTFPILTTSIYTPELELQTQLKTNNH